MDWFISGDISTAYIIPYILGCIFAFVRARQSVLENDDPGLLYHLMICPLAGILYSFPLYLLLIVFGNM